MFDNTGTVQNAISLFSFASMALAFSNPGDTAIAVLDGMPDISFDVFCTFQSVGGNLIPHKFSLCLSLMPYSQFPFLFGPPHYVWSQYLASLENLRTCSEVTEHRFADLNGLLRTLGIPLSGTASLAARALAGALVMGVCWTASRREAEPLRSLVWLSATAGYLMEFNPMTEANSYVILAPVLGLMAWRFMSLGKTRLGWLLAGMALTMGLLPNLLRPFLGNYFALAWHPAMTVGFLSVMVWQVFGASDPGPDPARVVVGPA